MKAIKSFFSLLAMLLVIGNVAAMQAEETPSPVMPLTEPATATPVTEMTVTPPMVTPRKESLCEVKSILFKSLWDAADNEATFSGALTSLVQHVGFGYLTLHQARDVVTTMSIFDKTVCDRVMESNHLENLSALLDCWVAIRRLDYGTNPLNKKNVISHRMPLLALDMRRALKTRVFQLTAGLFGDVRLHLAVCANDQAAVKALLAHRTPPTNQDPVGDRVPCTHSFQRVNVNSRDNFFGDSASHVAAELDHPECLMLLLERGSYTFVANDVGLTAGCIASSLNHKRCSRVLGRQASIKDNYRQAHPRTMSEEACKVSKQRVLDMKQRSFMCAIADSKWADVMALLRDESFVPLVKDLQLLRPGLVPKELIDLCIQRKILLPHNHRYGHVVEDYESDEGGDK